METHPIRLGVDPPHQVYICSVCSYYRLIITFNFRFRVVILVPRMVLKMWLGKVRTEGRTEKPRRIGWIIAPKVGRISN